ncbi:putative carbonic anhydrase 5 [Amphibalanus amphitrite]|uniref:carbonic anhydrase n=1 Tax=Amphibalanus amphitrite TaxID=1232801 RepID=A0A6A4X931_AMPAM|nr:putative carbonic anhydrase 5 [Amphibalanus amphitrite]
MARPLSLWLLLLLLPVPLLVGAADAEPRDQDDCAPVSPEQHPCYEVTGLRQSPISIDACAASVSVHQPLRITQLDRVPRRMTLENADGLVLGETRWYPDQQPTVSGGQLRGQFVLELLELHWGANSSSGSEHRVDGRRYAGELHLGFRNVKYATLEEALQNVDGLLGLAVLLDEDARSPGRGITALATGLFELGRAPSRAELRAPPTLRELLPEDLHRYVQYSGSATSDDCLETTTWLVFLTPVRVLPIELEVLRSLRDAKGRRLCSSAGRPLQPLSGRPLIRKGRAAGCDNK